MEQHISYHIEYSCCFHTTERLNQENIFQVLINTFTNNLEDPEQANISVFESQVNPSEEDDTTTVYVLASFVAPHGLEAIIQQTVTKNISSIEEIFESQVLVWPTCSKKQTTDNILQISQGNFHTKQPIIPMDKADTFQKTISEKDLIWIENLSKDKLWQNSSALLSAQTELLLQSISSDPQSQVAHEARNILSELLPQTIVLALQHEFITSLQADNISQKTEPDYYKTLVLWQIIKSKTVKQKFLQQRKVVKDQYAQILLTQHLDRIQNPRLLFHKNQQSANSWLNSTHHDLNFDQHYQANLVQEIILYTIERPKLLELNKQLNHYVYLELDNKTIVDWHQEQISKKIERPKQLGGFFLTVDSPWKLILAPRLSSGGIFFRDMGNIMVVSHDHYQQSKSKDVRKLNPILTHEFVHVHQSKNADTFEESQILEYATESFAQLIGNYPAEKGYYFDLLHNLLETEAEKKVSKQKKIAWLQSQFELSPSQLLESYKLLIK